MLTPYGRGTSLDQYARGGEGERVQDVASSVSTKLWSYTSSLGQAREPSILIYLWSQQNIPPRVFSKD